ncbi:MAG TPA: murein L,D-transpeptidase catalytic domain family protein [Thermoanaerobaculia bacterium]|nr:murein L,D-transpeptidase catalytic domain family protein [Thermoanaerobaculia bacterium]
MKRSFLLLAGIAAAILSFAPAVHAGGHDEPVVVSSTTVAKLVAKAPGLKADVLRMALEATRRAAEQGLVPNPSLLTVIDYSIPSTNPRLFVFDLSAEKLLYREHVAHGVASGGNVPTMFSNNEGSRQTSLGLFVTQETYFGSNGYSLRLRGLERGVNDMARARAIVMHGAPYVDPAAAKKQGRLGRSWGCPAVRSAVAKAMIDKLKGGSAIFAYYPERSWLSASRFLDESTQRGG